MGKKPTDEQVRNYALTYKRGASPRAEAYIDKMVDKVYRENCSGIQINMMDIPKVFAAGREALAEGRDLKTAIIEFVETIRCDGKKRAASC